MPADQLDKARAAGDELAAAERKVLETRGEYHTAIRRLHLAGASLREIAEALSISHQRVQHVQSKLARRPPKQGDADSSRLDHQCGPAQ